MEKAAPEPEIPDVTGLPTWLIHFLLFISRGEDTARICGVLGGFAMQRSHNGLEPVIGPVAAGV